MKILALITARGGSKRIPRKNLRLLGGKPLITWSIDAAKNISEICDILVSTDNEDIAQIARKANVMVPWLRPAELATDIATSVDVCIHALNWYEDEHGKVDGILLLQPTSPFRRKKSIINGIKLFVRHDLFTVIGVSPVKTHPFFCFKDDGEYISPFIGNGGLYLRTQDLPNAYVVNGAFYLTTPERLRDTQTFYNGKMVPLLFKEFWESIDIDELEDWKVAEEFLMTDKLQIELN